MAIKFEKIQPGMVLHDWGNYRMGNTTMREKCSWPVRIVSVNPSTRSAVVSWNGNPTRTWFARQLEKLRRESYDDAQKRKAGKVTP